MLPGLQDQATYYSRKIPMYNLTIVCENAKAFLTAENVFIYIWNETVFPKGANEIALRVFS